MTKGMPRLKEISKYLADLKNQGYRIERTKKRHIRVRDKRGRFVAITGGTSSDRKSLLNLKAEVRRKAKAA